MGKCCICGREGSFLAHGMWWCEEHYHMVEEDPEPIAPKPENNPGNRNTVDLGLEWV